MLTTTVERLALIRQQRAEAAKKREEEKAGTVLFPYLPSSNSMLCEANANLLIKEGGWSIIKSLIVCRSN